MVVGVEAKADQVLGKLGLRKVLIADAARPCGHVQPWLRLQVVVLELDLGMIKGHVGAALHVGNALARIVDRLAVDRDAHEIEAEGIGRAHLAGHAGDVHPLVVIEGDEFIIDDLHLDPRGIRLDEADIDHVRGLDIAPAFELRLFLGQSHLLAHRGHGPAGTRRGPADIVAVDGSGAPVEPLVAGIADKAQADVGLVLDLVHELPQPLGIAVGQDRVAVFEQDRIDARPTAGHRPW